MIKSKTFELKELIDRYHHPDEIYGYCQTCEHYNQNHSCPDHEHDPLDQFNPNDLITVYLLKMSYSADSDLSLEYRITRDKLDRAIKAFELATESYALIPGRCLLCDPCKKSFDQACLYPGRIRYSLETLGFNLDSLVTHEFDVKLQWDEPEITYIFGFIHKSKMIKDFSQYFKFDL